MKALQIKSRIVELIGEKIGTYRQVNIPAFFIGNVPNGMIANGLEVSIPSMPEFIVRGNQIVSERWSIRLTQFPSDDQRENIYEAMTILQKGLEPHPALTFIDKPTGNNIEDMAFLPSAVLRYEVVEVW